MKAGITFVYLRVLCGLETSLRNPSVLRRRLVNFFADRHRLVLTLAARLPRRHVTLILNIRMAVVDHRILSAGMSGATRSHVGLAVTIHVSNRDPLLMPIILRHLLACGLAALRVTRCQVAMHHFLIAHGSSRSLASSNISRSLHRSRGLVLLLLRLLFVRLRHRHQRQTRKSQHQNLALHLFSPMCGETDDTGSLDPSARQAIPIQTQRCCALAPGPASYRGTGWPCGAGALARENSIDVGASVLASAPLSM